MQSMRSVLGWPSAPLVAHVYASGASLAMAAPIDQLFSATEVNEWAWQGVACDTAGAPALPHAPGHAATWDAQSAAETLSRLAAAEASPRVIALQAAAAAHRIPFLLDDDHVSVGAGQGSRQWPIDQVPMPDEVPWTALHDVPTVLVTGSNGKTTTVRLVSALCMASGWTAGFNCTDGIFINGTEDAYGDYSGPAGARQVLRDRRVQAAILETARGGLLRRGLAVRKANVAIVTKVSDDHFGEYGVHDLSDLADAKLVVARAIGPDGVLVLNADDPVLVQKAAALQCPLAWFSLDDEHPVLRAHRLRGGRTCGVGHGQLRVQFRNSVHELGAVDAMPLSLSGSARYNVANIAGAALVAASLGIAAANIRRVLASFGATRHDNPGRLERWTVDGVTILLDYAHNPDGLSGLLGVAQALLNQRRGRLGLLLGQAGNRGDDAIRDLGRCAAAARPDFVMLKDLDGYLRGRAPGDVPALLRDELLRHGIPGNQIKTVLPELDAAQQLMAWARSGDVVVMPVHDLAARAQLQEWLDAR